MRQWNPDVWPHRESRKEKGSKEIQFLEYKINKLFTGFTKKLNLNEKIQIAGILNKIGN